ncbi:MAG: KAP family NTPase, partial [Gammaproteobacteria bacterium]|nr:KAP family NTPase [Gammaproteobacteria bacterium]
AITGPWGSGKTNLMGWIRDELKRRDYPVTWFSAWRHNQREAIWAAFARQIINDHIDTWRDLRLRWGRFWRQTSITGMIAFFGFIAVSAVLLSAGPNWLPDVFASHPVLSWLGSVLLAAVPFAKYWKPLLFSPLRRMATTTRGPDYTSVLGFQAAFEEDFRELVRLAGSEEKPLVIFIDDLDRAPPPIPAEIVEAINHLIGVKHCIFVIGLDLDMVSASIEAKYAKVIECLERSGISGTGFNGRRFLEKMIQITFSIPAISDEKYTTFLRRLLGDPDAPAHVNLKPAEKDIRLMVQPVDTLSSVVKNPRAQEFVEAFSESPEVRKAVYSASDYLQRNPRAIKRFINNFRLACFIANRNNLFTGGNMDLAHLAAVVAAATEYPRIYRVWQRNDYQLRLKQLIDAWSVDDYKFKDNEEIKDLQLSGVRYAANIRECLLTLMRINDKQLYTSLSALFDSTPVNEETAAESPAPGKNKK